MKRLCFMKVILICFLFNLPSLAQINTPEKHYAYAVDLMENRAYDIAKIEFIKIIHIYGENDYHDDARYHLGDIAFNQNQYEIALQQWERLQKEYPQSPYLKDVAEKIHLVSDLLAKEQKVRIEDLSIKTLFDNAEFLLEGHSPVLSIDTSYLPTVKMAEEWYRIIAEKYPDSEYAPEALYRQILIAYGWGRKSIEGYNEGHGFQFYRYYYEGAKETTRLGIERSLKNMESLLTELKEKYPNSYQLISATFIVGQAHWSTYKYIRDLSSPRETEKYFQQILELTEKNELSIYRQIAKARLEELKQD